MPAKYRTSRDLPQQWEPLLDWIGQHVPAAAELVYQARLAGPAHRRESARQLLTAIEGRKALRYGACRVLLRRFRDEPLGVTVL